MLKKWIICLAISLPLTALSQKPMVWAVLGMTTYTNDVNNEGAFIPNFPLVLISQYEGEEVFISGYLIPIDVEANKYALSKNPFTSCFFCGNAGPETVIELQFKEDPGRFATDEYLMIKGTLKLNHKGGGLFYVLKSAELHG